MRSALFRHTGILFILLGIGLLIGCQASTESEVSEETEDAAGVNSSQDDIDQIIEEMKIVNLLRDSLALAPDVEVIISYLELPDSTLLPTHYHPGEEFVYMIDGEGVLTIDGGDITLKEGDFYKIPMKEVHKFATSESQGRAVVFRAHEKGQPDRFLVEE